MYAVIGFDKSWEEDRWEDGCQRNTGGMYHDGTLKWTAENFEKIVAEVMEFCGTDDKNAIYLNACGDPGRIDIQVLETDNADVADEKDLAKWKKGELRLWLANYTFFVQEYRPVALPEIEGFMYETPQEVEVV